LVVDEECLTINVVNLETGFLVNLFLALHSYFPLSAAERFLIMRSDLRLEIKVKKKNHISISKEH
jgi:hypothetical protein